MSSVEARMQAAFELHALVVAIRREALGREHPQESAAQIEARLSSWLLGTDRPTHALEAATEPAR